MQKTERQGYYKVDESIVLNNDGDALAAYRKQKMKNLRLEKLENDLTEIKNDMEEIKNLLRGLIK